MTVPEFSQKGKGLKIDYGDGLDAWNVDSQVNIAYWYALQRESRATTVNGK